MLYEVITQHVGELWCAVEDDGNAADHAFVAGRPHGGEIGVGRLAAVQRAGREGRHGVGLAVVKGQAFADPGGLQRLADEGTVGRVGDGDDNAVGIEDQQVVVNSYNFV